MPRVLGIDPGTISLDICALDDGRVFVDRTIPTAEALADPDFLPQLIESVGPIDLVAGPSGYGLPLVTSRDLTEEDVRLACLAAPGESGGLGGLAAVMRGLARAPVPVVFTPGVIHLPSVPAYRKINRVDMGTADKVCAAALAIHDEAVHRDCAPADVSFILLELGGAFSAALAIERGRIVDGLGGTSGPMGMQGAGALDGETAFLAGAVSKAMLFRGGVRDVPEDEGRAAFVESALKAVAALRVSAPLATEVLLSGRLATEPWVRDPLAARLGHVRVAGGFASVAKHAAQGAALVAEGLAGGASAHLVDTLGLRNASGSVLDHLHIVTRATAAQRIGIATP
jgi:predicted butyrate kinase (DUF1464 family)